MTLDYLPSKEWIGKVDYIYPIIDAKNRTIKVRLRFKNSDDLLKPGMFAQISINTSSQEEVLVIPSESLIELVTQKELYYLWVKADLNLLKLKQDLLIMIGLRLLGA